VLVISSMALLGLVVFVLLAVSPIQRSKPLPRTLSKGDKQLSLPGPAFAAQLPPSRGPFPDGQQVTLQQAESMAPYPIYRPQTAIASDDTIAAVWIQTVKIDAPDTQIAIYYSSGIQVMLQPLVGDPALMFPAQAKEIGLPQTSAQT